MRLAVLFSGGKDSCYALHLAVKQGHEIACLVNIVSESNESYMFHTPNIHLAELQAKAIGLPLLKKTTKGEKEKELADLKDAIIEAKEKFKIQGVVTGAVASVYQASRIKKICEELGLECVNPLWGKDQVELLNELLENKFSVLISGIFAYPLDEKWLGRIIDRDIVSKLSELKQKYKLNPAGEGGEIETTVLDAPFFKKKIAIVDSEIKAKDNEGIFVVKKAVLEEK
ncbi:MAG: diphthine--ammonia ligase [Candidatus Woesearchaeota archaeon]